MAVWEGSTDLGANLPAGPRSLLEGAPLAMMRVGMDGRLRYANNAAAPLLAAWNVNPGDPLPDPVPEMVRAALVDRRMVVREVDLTDRTLMLKTGAADEHGVPLYATDVTQIIRVESAMVQGGELILSLLEAAPMVLFSAERDGAATVYAAGGLSIAEDNIDPLLVQVPALADRLEHAFSDEEPPARLNLIDPNSGRIFNLNFSCIRDEVGSVQRVMVAGMDITDRHNHLEEIKLRETQYRSVFETVREGLVVLSRNGRILEANPAACDLFRLPLDRIIGQRMLPFVHPDDHSFLRDCDEGLREGRSVQGLITALRTNGGSFDAAIIVTPFRAVGDASALAAIRDVTDEHAAQMALQRMNARLETLVAERTFALKQSRDRLNEQANQLSEAYRELKSNHAQLAQSEKMASLGQLAAGVAHEINNPVGYVMSNLRTLAEYIELFSRRMAGDDLDEELRSVLEDASALVEESTEGMVRVTEIVDGLKRFTRADDYTDVEADINDLIDLTLRVLKNELKYTCAVETHLAELPSVKCNPGQINQVLMNLLVNAKQAIREHGTITITTSFESDADGGHIRIGVRDTGCGIPPENLPRLFNPFFTTKPVGKGTGLGLSITYSIVKQHGGAIEVESQEDVGTTFSVTLPVRSPMLRPASAAPLQAP